MGPWASWTFSILKPENGDMNMHSLWTALVLGVVLPTGMHAQSIAWFHPYVGTNAECTGVQRSSTGDLFMSGSTRNNNLFDGLAPGNMGYDDGFVARADAMGTMQWIHTIGATSADFTLDVKEFGGRITVRGLVTNWGGSSSINYNGTSTPITGTGAYIMQVDTAGSLLWLEQVNEESTDMLVHGTGNIYYAAAEDSMRYYKLSPDGVVLQRHTISDIVRGFAIAVSPDGDVWVAGQWASPYPSTVWWAGQTFTRHGIQNDILVAKFDPNGNALFATQFASDGSDYVNDMVLSDDGTMHLSGNFGGIVDHDGDTLAGSAPRWFLATFGPSGALLALDDTSFRASGSTGMLAMNDADEVIATINFPDTLYHDLDTLFRSENKAGILAKWDASGQLSWYTALGFTSPGRVNTGVNLGSIAGDSLFVGGRNGSAAYTALVIDTTYAPLTTSTAPIRALPDPDWNVYPNPASTGATLSGVRSGSQLQLVDPAGRVLWSRLTKTAHEFIDFTPVPPGCYTLRLLTGSSSSSRRVLVFR